MRTNIYGEPVSAVRSSWLAIERMAPRRRRCENEYEMLLEGIRKTAACGTRETERNYNESLAEVCYA